MTPRATTTLGRLTAQEARARTLATAKLAEARQLQTRLAVLHKAERRKKLLAAGELLETAGLLDVPVAVLTDLLHTVAAQYRKTQGDTQAEDGPKTQCALPPFPVGKLPQEGEGHAGA